VHICFVCHEYPPAPHGGTGSSYHDLARGLVEAGHQVTVVGCHTAEVLDALPPDKIISGLRVARLKRLPTWLPYRWRMRLDRWRLKRWLAAEHRRNPFTLIESSDFGGWLPQGGPDGVPVVIRIRGSNLFFDHELKRSGDPLEHDLEKQSILRADHLGSVSRYAASSTLALCGQPDRPCTVIYNAVDIGLFAPSEKIKTEPGLIVYANTINPKKGIEQLLDAMNIVCTAHADARLVIIGEDTQKGKDGRTYVERLRERVKPEFLGRVAFAGRLDREGGLLNHLHRAHICCYPSHMETFGIASVEAMAVGKPVIYSRTGPGPEVVEDGVSGLLCNPHDAPDIARGIMRLLDDSALAKRLGQGARARVLAMFDKKDWIGRNVDYYHQCLETR